MSVCRPPKTIEAETFLVKDINGKVKAKIEAMNGSAELLFYDHTGRQRIGLTSTGSNGALNLKDDAGGVGATMEVGASKDGMPSTIGAL